MFNIHFGIYLYKNNEATPHRDALILHSNMKFDELHFIQQMVELFMSQYVVSELYKSNWCVIGDTHHTLSVILILQSLIIIYNYEYKIIIKCFVVSQIQHWKFRSNYRNVV